MEKEGDGKVGSPGEEGGKDVQWKDQEEIIWCMGKKGTGGKEWHASNQRMCRKSLTPLKFKVCTLSTLFLRAQSSYDLG